MSERICGMATVPGREAALAEAIASIAPQMDRVYVYLDGHDAIPEVLSAYKNVQVVTGEKLGDRAKFYPFVPPQRETLPDDAWCFTVDDDIVYPPDYASTLIERASEWMSRYRCAVGVHGCRLSCDPLRSYIKNRTTRHTCRGFTSDRSEHIIGTGTACWHSSALSLDFDVFEDGQMADIWFALHAQQDGVRLFTVARPEGWLRLANNHPEESRTLWGQMVAKGDRAHVEAINRISWRLYELPPVRVVIFTYRRRKLLGQLVESLLDQGGERVAIDVIDDDPDQIVKVQMPNGEEVPVRGEPIGERYGVTHHVAPVHRGKRGFWEQVNLALSILQQTECSPRYLFIADDMRICSRFFERIEAAWASIADPSKGALVPIIDAVREHRPNWTAFAPKPYNRYADAIGWIDGCFYCDDRILSALDWSLSPIAPERWDRNPALSSGAWAQATTRLWDGGYRFYRTRASLVASRNTPSLMNPEARPDGPFPTVRFMDDLEPPLW